MIFSGFRLLRDSTLTFFVCSISWNELQGRPFRASTDQSVDSTAAARSGLAGCSTRAADHARSSCSAVPGAAAIDGGRLDPADGADTGHRCTGAAGDLGRGFSAWLATQPAPTPMSSARSTRVHASRSPTRRRRRSPRQSRIALLPPDKGLADGLTSARGLT
jgi:hypothetical protein